MDWTAIIGQIPFVATFVWYALESQKRHQTAQALRDQAFIEALARFDCRLNEIDEKNETRLQNHDTRAVSIESKIDQLIAAKAKKPANQATPASH